jgi:hypothetical protein
MGAPLSASGWSESFKKKRPIPGNSGFGDAAAVILRIGLEIPRAVAAETHCPINLAMELGRRQVAEGSNAQIHPNKKSRHFE